MTPTGIENGPGNAGRSSRTRFAVGVFLGLFLLWSLLFLFGPPSFAALVWLLGAAPVIGILLAFLGRQTETVGEIVFFIPINAAVAVSLLGGLVWVLPHIPLTSATYAGAFALLYLVLLGIAAQRVPHQFERIRRPELTRSEALIYGSFALVLLVSLVAFSLKRTTGHSLPNALVYLWVLVSFLLIFLRAPNKSRVHVFFLVLVGLLFTWVQALSTNGLFAIDGISTVRVAETTLTGIRTDIAAERLLTNLTALGTLPTVAALTRLPVETVARWVIPAFAGLSLVGIYVLSRRWLEPRWALGAAFLLSYHFPFYVELITLYRSALALPVLIGLYLSLTAHSSPARSIGVLYAILVPLLHDTVGIFLLGVLVGAAVVLALQRVRSPDSRAWRPLLSVFSMGSIVALTFYLAYVGSSAFDTFATTLRSVLREVTGGPAGGGTRRTLSTTVGSLDETLVEALAQTTIVLEIGVIATMTAFLIVGWLFRDRGPTLLPRIGGSRMLEALVIGNAGWFGVLVLQPLLGIPRVFLYASPFLVGLFSAAIRHFGTLLGSVGPPTRSTRSLGAVMFAGVVVVGFLVQSGLVAFAVGDHLSHPALGDSESVRLRYYHEADLAGNAWATSHVSRSDRLYADRFGEALLLDDPELRHTTLQRIAEDEHVHELLDRGCVFLRTPNVRSGRVLQLTGPGRIREVAYPTAWEGSSTIVYTAGATRIVC